MCRLHNRCKKTSAGAFDSGDNADKAPCDTVYSSDAVPHLIVHSCLTSRGGRLQRLATKIDNERELVNGLDSDLGAEAKDAQSYLYAPKHLKNCLKRHMAH